MVIVDNVEQQSSEGYRLFYRLCILSMLRTFVSKYRFWPRKEHRYFSLKYTLKGQLPTTVESTACLDTEQESTNTNSNTLPSEELRELQHHALLFSGSNNNIKFALFACDNESYPHTHLLDVHAR